MGYRIYPEKAVDLTPYALKTELTPLATKTEAYDLPLGFAFTDTAKSIANASWTTLTPQGDAGLRGGVWRFNTSNLVVPKAGWYRVWSHVAWNGNATGQRINSVAVNNVEVTDMRHFRPGMAGAFAYNSSEKSFYLNAGDQVSAVVYQDSGSIIQVLYARLFVEWVRHETWT